MLYIVHPGDCLISIALKFGVSIKYLLQLNPIAYYPLYVGQRLFIPLPNSRKITTYIVTTDDKYLGLDYIAEKFNTTKESIMELSKISSEDLTVGQELIIDSDSRISSHGSRETEKPYVVKVGETLDSIAQKFNVSKKDIMLLNSLSSDFIYPGQNLKIPSRSKKTFNDYRKLITYKIKVGDTLDSIAKKHNTTKKALLELNPDVSASENLEAGETINVEDSREYFPKTTANPQNNINTKYDFYFIYDFSLDKKIKIWKELGREDTFFFVSKMTVTAAGTPRAFHKENQLAYDFLDNAGTNGYWWSLVTDDRGVPVVQDIYDPAPGYYVSKTALSDCKKPLKDPTRYLDAEVIPYIALPAHHMLNAKLGDLCVVINTTNNKISYAIIGDVGPDDSIGVGSIALATDIGIVSSPKLGGVEDGILYIIFGQSGNGSCIVKTREQIVNEAQQLFEQWGGIEKVHALFNKFPLSHTSIE